VKAGGQSPAFLQAQSRIIPLAIDGRMSAERFEDAIRYNGRGPHWFAGTPYENLVEKTPDAVA